LIVENGRAFASFCLDSRATLDADLFLREQCESKKQ